jgi:hypothetical protein
MLTLFAAQATKALLVAMKKAYDLPQGRLLDNAVEEYAIKLLGIRKVRQIQKAMLDPRKQEQLMYETTPEANEPPDATSKVASAKKLAVIRSSLSANVVKKIQPRGSNHVTKGVSFLREPEQED